MPTEPKTKRTIAFVDGQNLFYAVKKAFGYTYPNYDVAKLAEAICDKMGWNLTDIYFYTGIPSLQDKPLWSKFWTKKLAVMGTQGIHVFSRELHYRNQTLVLPDGQTRTLLVGQEKGVDVRIALDTVRLARGRNYDVGLIFSQDQDLNEVVEEVRMIASERKRWIKLASAYPVSPTITNRRGIDKTDWIHIDRKLYDSCLDCREYRPKKQ